MSAILSDIEQTFSDRLEEYDRRIKAQDDTGQLLEEIHATITILMTKSGSDEDRMRDLLQKRYNAGKLRLETYQLVRDVLDRVAVESMATMPEALDDALQRTQVIGVSGSETDAPQDHLQVGTVLRDRFLLQERVAGGSMGVVYKALDRRLAEAEGFDPWVAIKVLSPKLARNAHALRALQQEAAKGRCLTHPNIVRFVDLDRDEDMFFIVMEWLDGRSLASILDENQNRKIDLTTALDIVRQVGQALDYAHRCGVVHADVKPANIMITPSGQVKLFDFGVARIRQKQHQMQKDFDPGVLGAVTPAYSSMQVLTGEDPTPADDVFSLGCLMYRMVAGHRVFGPRNAAEAAEQGMEPQRPQGLGEAQWRALRKALAFSRVARYATPAEFLKALDAEDSSPRRRADDRLQKPSPAEDRPLPQKPVEERPPPQPPVEDRAPPPSRVEDRPPPSAVADRPLPQIRDEDRAPTRFAVDPILVEPKEQQPTATRNWGLAVAGIAVLGVAAVLALQPDWLPERFRIFSAPEQTAPDAEPTEAGRDDLAPATGESVPPETAQPDEELPPPTVVDETGTAEPAEAPDEALEPVTLPEFDSVESQLEPVEEPEEIIDFSTLPPPTAVVSLPGPDAPRSEVDLTIREDQGDVTVDFVRDTIVGEPLTLRLEEVGFSGNRSPWSTGRLQLDNDGILRFPAGQNRARLTLSMPSNSEREPDGEATLLVRNVEVPGSELAIIDLKLEDDDQRSFESDLPRNAVGFSVSEIVARESDPAVLIDVLRFNPDDAELEVRYRISGGTAEEGEDYFLPGTTGLVFGPGQRQARLLIPLVQDTVPEDDETFSLEFGSSVPTAPDNIRRQITVIIADDDGAY